MRALTVVGDKPPIERKIAQLAAKQQRNVTRQQLLAMGVNPRAIDYRVRIGRLHLSYSGVYTLGYPPVTPLERAMAAVLACGPRAALSHGSAMALWGLWKPWEAPLHVTVAADRRPRGIRVHRVRTLDREDVTRQHGIPVTTLARTLLDLARWMTAKSLTRAVNDGRLTGRLNSRALADVVKRNPRHRGAAKLAAILGLAGVRPTRSHFEDEFPAFCERFGLPRPDMDAIICGHEVDALFLEERVIVELDSWEFHSSRTSFESDRSRDADTLAGGFATVRLTWERYRQEPEREAERLNAILARRRRRAA